MHNRAPSTLFSGYKINKNKLCCVYEYVFNSEFLLILCLKWVSRGMSKLIFFIFSIIVVYNTAPSTLFSPHKINKDKLFCVYEHVFNSQFLLKLCLKWVYRGIGKLIFLLPWEECTLGRSIIHYCSNSSKNNSDRIHTFSSDSNILDTSNLSLISFILIMILTN